MQELEALRQWYGYNATARQRYVDTLATLAPAELTRDRGASFPSMLDILYHSVGGIDTWITRMSALNGEKFRPFEGSETPSLDDLREYSRTVEGHVGEFFGRLSEAELDRAFVVPKMPPWWDEDFTTSIRSTLRHVVEHELQHRGELNALLWQIDVEPPILDWDEFEKLEGRAPKLTT